MAGPLGKRHGRASKSLTLRGVVGLAACAFVLTVLACERQAAGPSSPTLTSEGTSAEQPTPALASATATASGSSSTSPAATPTPVATAVATTSSAATTVSASASTLGSPVQIEVGEPKFTSGDVANAKASLEKLTKKFKTCIDDNGGLTAPSGELELSFLVRAAGQAEGADVGKVKGIGDAARKCVRDALKKKAIGTPTDDPIGVTVVLKLTAKK